MPSSLDDLSDDEILRRANYITARRRIEQEREEALAQESYILCAAGGSYITIPTADAQLAINAYFDRLLGDLAED